MIRYRWTRSGVPCEVEFDSMDDLFVFLGRGGEMHYDLKCLGSGQLVRFKESELCLYQKDGK